MDDFIEMIIDVLIELGIKVFLIGLIIIILIWGGYTYYNKHYKIVKIDDQTEEVTLEEKGP